MMDDHKFTNHNNNITISSNVIGAFCHGLYGSWKTWNFIMAFSRTGKSWKKATGPVKVWKSVKLNYVTINW